MNCTLLEWLNSDPLAEDIMPLTIVSGIDYIPVPVVRSKMDIMENHFGVEIIQNDLQVSAVSTPAGRDADVIFWGTVKFTLKHPEFKGGVKRICGTASFYVGQYSGWSFAQTAESLAIAKAFSKHFKQFGKGLNDKEDPIKDMKAPGKKKSLQTDASVKSAVKNALK
jgi:hypothetical protein